MKGITKPSIMHGQQRKEKAKHGRTGIHRKYLLKKGEKKGAGSH